MRAPTFSVQTDNDPLIYFGKLPSRGDFVRSSNGSAVIQSLDRWLTACLEELATDADWKQYFDTLPGIQFAFVGSRNPNLLIGRIATSHDSSGRRYPFLVAGGLRTNPPITFLPNLPICMHTTWENMERLMSSAMQASSIGEALGEIEVTRIETPYTPTELIDQIRTQLQDATVGMLEDTLTQAGNRLTLRYSVIALGLLLSPLLTASADTPVSKGLALPLPEDHNGAITAATFWLSLVAPFVERCPYELCILRSRLAERPQLIINFGGADPQTLQSVFNPTLAFENNVDLCESEWVEDYLVSEHALVKLASYLELPELTLAQALETFGEVFLGT